MGALVLTGGEGCRSALDDDDFPFIETGDGGVGDGQVDGTFGIIGHDAGGKRFVAVALVGNVGQGEKGLSLDEQRTAHILGKGVAVVFTAAHHDVVVSAGRVCVGLTGCSGQ